MEGLVYINGQISDKAGTNVDVDSEIELRGDQCPFVSRGGLKLAKALEVFKIDLSSLTCMDIGASTGGFTDCMLQAGAAKVYSVDVGYGQLDWKLRCDERIVNMEKVNVRYLETGTIVDKIDFISIDVSFISLKLILPVAARLLDNGRNLVCLIKPQFEAGRSQVGKNGIVRDKDVHLEVIRNVASYALENGFHVSGLSFSPMTGAKGNIEYLMLLTKGEDEAEDSGLFDPDAIVSEAHRSLNK